LEPVQEFNFVSQRIPKVQTLHRKGNEGPSGVLTFKPFKTVENEDEPDKSGERHLQIYEAFYGKQIFGYLYVTADQYSLVWKSSGGFKFELPYTQVELQFSDLPTRRIYDKKLCLPVRNWAEKKCYENKRATVSLFLLGEDDVREFDLLDDKGRDEYMSEFVIRQAESGSEIAFARYDSEILFEEKHLNICFTAERMDPEANDDWEFVINLPRHILITPRSLRWAIENHELNEVKGEIDFKASRFELANILNG